MARAPRTAPAAGRRFGSGDSKAESVRQFDRWRREHDPCRALYGLRRWRAKSKAQLAAEPLCRMCQAEGVVTAATVADHIEPHRGDPDQFWNGALQSLCAFHHNRDKQRAERGAR
jgi:hypothetical protein